MTLYDAVIAPFADFAFMRRALAGCIALSAGAAPVGVFLMLRRMSLTGDAMAHAILPGAALGFLAFGLKLIPMTVGGMIAGLCVAFLSGIVTRVTSMKEDASLASFYLISLALGVMIVSLRGSSIDLMHVLFGTVLALDDNALFFIAGSATVTLLTLAIILRPLTLECIDPRFLSVVSPAGGPVHLIFLGLVVLNLVSGFQALGTLLAVGIMMLPATAARFWSRNLVGMAGIAFGIAMLSSGAGLLLSYHVSLPSGPAIILSAGGLYVLSLMFGPAGGVVPASWLRRHRTA
jgi:zinc/manganese transport system permease protein